MKKNIEAKLNVLSKAIESDYLNWNDYSSLNFKGGQNGSKGEIFTQKPLKIEVWEQFLWI